MQSTEWACWEKTGRSKSCAEMAPNDWRCTLAPPSGKLEADLAHDPGHLTAHRTEGTTLRREEAGGKGERSQHSKHAKSSRLCSLCRWVGVRQSSHVVRTDRSVLSLRCGHEGREMDGIVSPTDPKCKGTSVTCRRACLRRVPREGEVEQNQPQAGFEDRCRSSRV